MGKKGEWGEVPGSIPEIVGGTWIKTRDCGWFLINTRDCTRYLDPNLRVWEVHEWIPEIV